MLALQRRGRRPGPGDEVEQGGFPEAVRIVAELSGIVASRDDPPAGSPTPAAAVAADPGRTASPPPERSSGLPRADALALVDEAAGRLWSPRGTAARPI